MSPSILTTSWDDGHPLDLRIADMLARYGLSGTFYIPRKIETGVMTDAQVRELANHFEIGAHTLNHVFLSDTDDATARSEISGSRQWVMDVTGQACGMFCPPAGRYKRQHLPMFQSAGFGGIRSVEFCSLDDPRRRGGIVEMPTTLQAFEHSRKSYLKNIAKRLAAGNLLRFMALARQGDWVMLVERFLNRCLSRGGVFHLWGHSWEIDRAGQWDQLDRALRLMGEAAKQAPCLTNGQVCQRVQG